MSTQKLCNCLTGLVGLRGLCEDQSCVRFVNDIPLLSNQSFTELRDAEHLSAESVFAQIEKNAIDRLSLDVFSKMDGMINRSGQTDYYLSGRIERPLVQIPSADELRLFAIDTRGDFREADIKYIIMQALGPGTIDMYVYDGFTGVLLDSWEQSITAGRNTIILPDTVANYYTSEDSIMIGYRPNGVVFHESETTSRTGRKPSPRGGYCDCDPCGHYYQCYRYELGGSDPADLTLHRDDLDYGSNCGMVLNYRVYCSLSAFLCEHTDLLSKPLQLAMGVEFMAYLDQIYGKANKLTLIDQDTKQAIKDDLKDLYDEALTQFIESSAAKRYCYTCQSDTGKIQLTP